MTRQLELGGVISSLVRRLRCQISKLSAAWEDVDDSKIELCHIRKAKLNYKWATYVLLICVIFISDIFNIVNILRNVRKHISMHCNTTVVN
jgi:hypothetical protein